MREAIQQQIRSHIVETWLDGDARGFGDDVDLVRAGVLDSFSMLALASYLDETFKIEVDPVDINAQTFHTVRTVADLVLEKLGTSESSQ